MSEQLEQPKKNKKSVFRGVLKAFRQKKRVPTSSAEEQASLYDLRKFYKNPRELVPWNLSPLNDRDKVRMKVATQALLVPWPWQQVNSWHIGTEKTNCSTSTQDVEASGASVSTSAFGPGSAEQPASPRASVDLHVASTQPSGEVKAPEAPAVRRTLHVQVICARDLLAADNNGLSDPYCIVYVGSNKVTSRVISATLAPTWNEHFVFRADEVEQALQAGQPWIHFRCFDYDVVSQDDFLGKASLEFKVVEVEGGSKTWLQLYREGRTGKKKFQGEVQVAAWFEEAGASHPTSLCYPPGVAKHVPLVVHAGQNSLYEEPLIACLAVTLEAVERPPSVVASPQAALSGVSALGPTAVAAKKEEGHHSFLGRESFLEGLFRRKGHAPGRAGVAALGRSSYSCEPSAASTVSAVLSDDTLDEEEDLNFVLGGAALGQSLSLDEAPSLATLAPLHEEDEGGVAPAAETGSPAGATLQGDEDDALSGKLLYCKMTLGRQVRQSFIKKERSSGTTRFCYRSVFAVPVPVKNRQVVIDLYRTSSSTRKGRLIATAQVLLFDLLPQLTDPPKAAGSVEPGLPDPGRKHHSSHALQSVDKRLAGGQVVLSGVVVDQDERRKMYGHGLSDLVSQGDGAGEEGKEMLRLQSSTHLMSDREQRKRSQMTEEGYEAWHQRLSVRLLDSARSSASAKAQEIGDALNAWAGSASQAMGWSPSSDESSTLPTPHRVLSGCNALSAADAGSSGAADLPQPPATLHLTLSSLHLPGVGSECFVVLKCGQHWGRTALMAHNQRGTVDLNWQVCLPVHEPSSLLLVTVFKQPARAPFHAVLGSQAASPAGRKPGGIIGPNMPQMVGKLRIRLSCVSPNHAITASLPLLSERKKGAQQVGTLDLTLQVLYASGKVLLKSYLLRPPLPEAAYYHGLQESACRATLEAETRRIVVRWLETANPAIPKPVALAVLDTEREEFVMSRMKVNFRRFRLMAAGLSRFKQWLSAVQRWDNPAESSLVCAACVLLAFRPSIVIPVLLVWASLRVAANKPETAGDPLAMEHDPPEIEPDDVELATSSSNPYTILMKKYEALQGLMLRVQNFADDLATALEKMQALGSWQDPVATTIFMAGLLGIAFIIFTLGFSTIVAFALFWTVRPPRLRTPTPPPPSNLFKRLPSRADRIM